MSQYGVKMLVGEDNVLMYTGQVALGHALDYFKGLDKWGNIDIPSEMSPLLPGSPAVVRPTSIQVQ